jgi:hypothetical protein
VNRRLGVAFRRPHNWVFSDVAEMGEVAKGQILQLNDLKRLDELWPDRSLPVLTISRDQISAQARTFTPGVQIFLDRILLPKELKKMGFEVVSPLEVAADDIESNDQVLKNFDVTHPPMPRTVSQCDAAEYTASFLFEHHGLSRPVPVRMRTLCVWQDPAFYTVRMYDAPANGLPDTVDYEDFIATVRMV